MRRVQFTVAIILASVAGMIGGVLATCIVSPAYTYAILKKFSEDRVTEVLKARSFEAVDDEGQTVVVLRAGQGCRPSLTFYENGQQQFSVGPRDTTVDPNAADKGTDTGFFWIEDIGDFITVTKDGEKTWSEP